MKLVSYLCTNTWCGADAVLLEATLVGRYQRFGVTYYLPVYLRVYTA
jgi:hypothetical protein